MGEYVVNVLATVEFERPETVARAMRLLAALTELREELTKERSARARAAAEEESEEGLSASTRSRHRLGPGPQAIAEVATSAARRRLDVGDVRSSTAPGLHRIAEVATSTAGWSASHRRGGDLDYAEVTVALSRSRPPRRAGEWRADDVGTSAARW